MTARPVVKSADRVVDVLELLASEPQGLTVTELGKRLRIARSSIHGLVSTLLARGYLKEDHAQNGAARKLRLGSRLIQLGLNVGDQVELRSAARPILERLVSVTHDTALLVVPERGELLYVDKVVSGASGVSDVRTDPRMSARRPLQSTSVGKALLAALADEDARALIDEVGLPPVTEFTILRRSDLLADLGETRRRRYALDRQEAFLGVCCVGAPIRDYTRRPVASLSLSSVVGMFDADRSGPLVVEAAVEISKNLGWDGDLETLYEPVPGSLALLLGDRERSRGDLSEASGRRVGCRTASTNARWLSSSQTPTGSG